MCKVFVTMLALKDADQVVRHTAYALSKKCWPGDPDGERRVLDAIRILSSPDTKRIEPQPHEGRRIEKVDGGWFILNGQFYEDMMRSINRKVYKAAKQREYREKKRLPGTGRPLPGEAEAVRALNAGNVQRFEEIAATPASQLGGRTKATKLAPAMTPWGPEDGEKSKPEELEHRHD